MRLAIALALAGAALMASVVTGLLILARRWTRPPGPHANDEEGRLVAIEVVGAETLAAVPISTSADDEAAAVWRAAEDEPGFSERLERAIERMERDGEVVAYEPRRRVG